MGNCNLRLVKLYISICVVMNCLRMLAQRNINKRPWMALYAGGFGGLIGCLFFLMALWARSISKQHGGWAFVTA